MRVHGLHPHVCPCVHEQGWLFVHEKPVAQLFNHCSAICPGGSVQRGATGLPAASSPGTQLDPCLVRFGGTLSRCGPHPLLSVACPLWCTCRPSDCHLEGRVRLHTEAEMVISSNGADYATSFPVIT